MTIPLLTEYNNKLIPINELNRIRSTGQYETRNIAYEPENWKNIKLENIKPENSKIIDNNEHLSNTQVFNQKVLNFAIASAASLPPPIAGPFLAAAAAYYSTKEVTTSMDLWRANIDATLFDINYLQPVGFRYIESRNVKTT